MRFVGQVFLLLWKNWLLQKSKPCVTVFEVSMPVFFAALIMAMRFQVAVEETTQNTTYPQFPVNMTGSKTFNDSDASTVHRILYTPNSILIAGVMLLVKNSMEKQNTKVNLQGFETGDDLVNEYKFHPDNVTFAVEFLNVVDPTLPTTLTYKLRPTTTDWRTDVNLPFVINNSPRDNSEGPFYRNSGFLWMQRVIDTAIITTLNPGAIAALDGLDIEMQRMPFPPYRLDGMVDMLKVMLPMFLMMSFILMAIQTTKGVVYEKERRLKESMKLMGLSASAHWMSWFLTIFMYILVFSGIFSCFCCLRFSDKGAVLANSDPSVFFVFLLCYGMSIISFCFMVSVFTQKANVAAGISGVVYFITYCPYFYFQTVYEQLTRPQKLGSSLLFNVAMSFGGNTFALYEGAGDGVQWNNINKPPSLRDNLSLLDSMLMMLGDSALYFLVTWYVDNVFPGEYGVPKPFYFMFTATYWCGSNQVTPDASAVAYQDDAYFEKEPTGLEAGISIRNLRKVFGSGDNKNVAVDGMNLNMFEGQITVLLGHNGAGKTTTMSVLTGFIPASGGTALVNGYDINTDVQSVRQSLGLCPQHNILFDTLTVYQHLQFFLKLKGFSGKIETEVNRMIGEVGLDSKRRTQSQHLSGGQKRKLSVGIALIGGSKVVILDEPTSGMDPAARRQTWDILQRNRHGRTMLLTTHFMDEADLLGDRIAIMTEGVVKCCGTSYFLKKLYGAGYHLVAVKQPGCNTSAVTSVVQKHVSTGQLESEINAELSYLLPDDQSANFPALFSEIEKRSGDLRVSSFGVTATTMEEVFLKVDQEKTQTSNSDEIHLNEKSTLGSSRGYDNLMMGDEETGPESYGSTENGAMLSFNKGFTKSRGLFLELSRFRGMFIKKMLHTWRNKTITITQILIPVIAAILGLLTSSISTSQGPDPPKTMDLSPFGGSVVPYQNGSTVVSGAISQAYVNLLAGSSDVPEYVDLSRFDNMSAYFLDKSNSMGINEFSRKVIIAAEFQSDSVVIGHYNGQPFQSSSISLAYVMNAMLKYFTTSDRSITTINHPLPTNLTSDSEDTNTAGMAIGFAIAVTIVFGMAFLTSSFVYFLIKEREVGAKHLQVVCGVGPFVFWMSNLAWDFINYMMTVVCILIVFAAFQTGAYTYDGRLGLLLVVFILYGWAILPCMYMLQYGFKTPATGMVIIIVVNILTGTMSVMISFLITLLAPGSGQQTMDTILAAMFPHHAFGVTFFQIYSNYANLAYCVKQNYEAVCQSGISFPCCKETCGDVCLNFNTDYMGLEVPGIGRYLIIMGAQGLLYMMVILAIDYHLPQKISYLCRGRDVNVGAGTTSSAETALPEDSDVSAERIRIGGIHPSKHGQSDAIVLKNLTKTFGQTVAVDRLNVGIAEKECFGLLGQNGAGKTSTFRMMTGEVMVTGGNAYLWSYDIKNHTKQVQENMGYCPQFDALIDQMTGRETLAMYARLKGIPEKEIKHVCKDLLDTMMLNKYADKSTSEYSGGNKRKLSTAIALVGDPAFIMLDEPSTGMDPKARRQLWTVLSKVRECGRTLILTSHSMEECEALCTRIAIMVNGRFVCLGTPQHLKSKFGQGYTLIARMSTLEDGQPTPQEPLVDFIKSNYPGTHVFDDHQGYVHFQVPDTSVSLAHVFSLMERARSEFKVEDYSVHQTTIEQVFLSFTRSQLAPKEEAPKPCCRKVCCCCFCCCCCC